MVTYNAPDRNVRPSNSDVIPQSLIDPPAYPYVLSRMQRTSYEYSDAYTGGTYTLDQIGDSATVRFTNYNASRNGLNQYLPFGLSIPAIFGSRWVLLIAPTGCITEISGFNSNYAGFYKFPFAADDPVASFGSESAEFTFPADLKTSIDSYIWNFKYTRTTAPGGVFEGTLEVWRDGDEGNKTTQALWVGNVSDDGTSVNLVVGNVEGFWSFGNDLSYTSVDRCTILGVTFNVAA